MNDGERGATVEAVISRMKTVQATSTRRSESSSFRNPRMRLIAISATIPNVVDVSERILNQLMQGLNNLLKSEVGNSDQFEKSTSASRLFVVNL